MCTIFCAQFTNLSLKEILFQLYDIKSKGVTGQEVIVKTELSVIWDTEQC